MTEAASLFTVPTDGPEADGTFCWKSTTLVLVRLQSGKTCGTGHTYADAGTASSRIAQRDCPAHERELTEPTLRRELAPPASH
jgi:hypothetical protein